ncbi:uncharacterized protein [Scyliorhinus torazame]|uniref:uncharacterized protein n=1 Tax=Scyliorhinus torazame TaxID=75743 RepID=UPI003B5AC0F6
MSSLQNINIFLKLFDALYEFEGLLSETKVRGLRGISENIIPILVNFNAICSFDDMLYVKSEFFLHMLQGFHRVMENIYRPITSKKHILDSVQESVGGLYLNEKCVESCFVLYGRYVVASCSLKNHATFGQLSVKFNFGQQNEILIMIGSYTPNIKSGNYFEIIYHSPFVCILKLIGTTTVIPPGLYNQSAEVPCEGVGINVNPKEIAACLIIPPHWRERISDYIVQRANSNSQCDYMQCGEIDTAMECIHQFTIERFTSTKDTDMTTYLMSRPMSNMCPLVNEKGQVFAFHLFECPYTNHEAENSFIGKGLNLKPFVKHLQAIGIDVLGRQ